MERGILDDLGKVISTLVRSSNNNDNGPGDSYLGNMIVKPLRASLASDTVKVSRIIACHMLKDIMHLISRDKRQQRLDQSMMAELGQVCVV